MQEDENLIESDDEALLRIAQDMERAVVTENVKDCLPLDAVTHGAGRAHYGLIFTTNRSFPRHHRRFVGAITAALADCLEHEPRTTAATSAVHWLRPAQTTIDGVRRHSPREPNGSCTSVRGAELVADQPIRRQEAGLPALGSRQKLLTTAVKTLSMLVGSEES